jgi:diphthamide synthase (EF-2-diphthine--ammonia ligase)
MAQALAAARAEGATAVAFGDLFLEEVRRYREERMAGTGLGVLFPLWGRPTRELAEEMLAAGQKAVLTCVDPRVVPRELAGRAFDTALLDSLPPGTDPCGENGEFHSFAWDGPAFRRPVPVRVGDVVERDGFVFADVLPASGAQGRVKAAARAARGTGEPGGAGRRRR